MVKIVVALFHQICSMTHLTALIPVECRNREVMIVDNWPKIAFVMVLRLVFVVSVQFIQMF